MSDCSESFCEVVGSNIVGILELVILINVITLQLILLVTGYLWLASHPRNIPAKSFF
jgi:hypothetical protein